ncbi:MAG: hypothetical protein P0Y59_21355 [Candidatus Sphingomonas phytovorans]|nr:hypothetical protein [Sphingomonas sp.]WEJ99433.1 MAG: hypothetical protein P0Y59_21355 [Sphingomonas sp.]
MKKIVRRIVLAVLVVTLVCVITIFVWFTSIPRKSLDQCLIAVRAWEIQDSNAFVIFYGCEKLAEEAINGRDARGYRFMSYYNDKIKGDAWQGRNYMRGAMDIGDENAKLDLVKLIIDDPEALQCTNMLETLASYKPSTPVQIAEKNKVISQIKQGDCSYSSELRRKALGPD